MQATRASGAARFENQLAFWEFKPIALREGADDFKQNRDLFSKNSAECKTSQQDKIPSISPVINKNNAEH